MVGYYDRNLDGYYFVLTEYNGGRYGYSEQRFPTEQEAEHCATVRRKRVGIKKATVKYQAGQTAIDIKKFI